MATLTPPAELTRAYNEGLAIAAGKGARDVLAAMRTADPKDFASAWPVIGKRITEVVTKGQKSSLYLSTWYLAEAIAIATNAPAGLVDVKDTTGRLRTGLSVGQYVARTPDVITARISDGMKPELAVDMSTRRLVGLASTEPHRIARAAVAYGAVNDERITGWRRVAEANACSFCRMLASKGAAYTSRESANVTSSGQKYHLHCHCYAEVVFSSQAAEINAAGAQAWGEMDTPTIYSTGTRSAGRARPARMASTTDASIDAFARIDSSIALERIIIAEKSRIPGRTAAAEKRLASLQARREAMLARHYAAPGAADQLEAALAARERARLSAQLLEAKSTLAAAQIRVATGDLASRPAVAYGKTRLADIQRRLRDL